MSSEAEERIRNRLKQIVDMKKRSFHYRSLREGIVEELEADEQLHDLLLIADQTRQVVEVRRSLVGCDDPMRVVMAEWGEVLNEEIHRRADEIITEVCASFVRQDDRWIADDSDDVDTTEIQAAFDGIERAIWWLDDHRKIVERLHITYPEDKW
ncbi:hypothetical protein [Halobacteriaceae bacterium SHR40]|uniref:hypothetical protein n=1 Tax=Halovenus amylolytica TaxID=2500550 RepID=UPI000FE2AAEF